MTITLATRGDVAEFAGTVADAFIVTQTVANASQLYLYAMLDTAVRMGASALGDDADPRMARDELEESLRSLSGSFEQIAGRTLVEMTETQRWSVRCGIVEDLGGRIGSADEA